MKGQENLLPPIKAGEYDFRSQKGVEVRKRLAGTGALKSWKTYTNQILSGKYNNFLADENGVIHPKFAEFREIITSLASTFGKKADGKALLVQSTYIYALLGDAQARKDFLQMARLDKEQASEDATESLKDVTHSKGDEEILAKLDYMREQILQKMEREKREESGSK